jgi:hypothetical protein
VRALRPRNSRPNAGENEASSDRTAVQTMTLSQFVHRRRNSCILRAVLWAGGKLSLLAGRGRAWGTEMLINRLLANSELGPDAIENLNLAFKQALRSLHLVDRDDPFAELVARKIIEIDATGVHDAGEIAKIAVKQLGIQ